MEKLLAILFTITLSVICSICVMIYGWGLTPKSWHWIIGVGFFGQVVLSAIMSHLARKDSK